MSEHLSKSALKALNRIGNIMIPENGEFPKFSDVGGLEHIDDLVSYAPSDDISDLSLLLSILAYMPGFILRWLVGKLETAHANNGPLVSLFRQLDFGLRGLIYSCYYGGKLGKGYTGKDPQEIIGFSIERVED